MSRRPQRTASHHPALSSSGVALLVLGLFLFATQAKLSKYSADEGSNYRGGVIDWTPAVRYVPQLQDAMKRLEKGQMTDAPVQSEYGWHVIRLDDERRLTFPAFEDVKSKIYQNLQRQAVDEIIAGLRSKAEIE